MPHSVLKLKAIMIGGTCFVACLQASSWCQTSMHILNEMDGKIEELRKSDEAASLTAEVAVYLSATSDQQEARIDQVGRG